MATNISEKQFNELEKRIASFKGLFGVFNSGTSKLISNEKFSKTINVYPENIINNSNDILFSVTPDSLAGTTVSTIYDASNNSNIQPYQVRTWTLNPDTTLTSNERIVRGSFTTTLTGYTQNPYVERIVMPLTAVSTTDEQFFVAYGAI